MGEDSTDKKSGDESTKPLPENAEIKEIKPSTWREFWKGCNDLFWQWYGLDTVAEDFNKHGGAVRKGAALRFLAIIAAIAMTLGFGLKGCIDGDLIQEKQALDIKLQNDENALGPLRQIANQKFAEAPPDKRIDLLLQEVGSLKNKVESMPSVSNTILSATVGVNLTIIKDKQVPGSITLMGAQLAIGFGSGTDALLIATSQKIDSQLVGDKQIQFSVNGETPVNSPSMGKPIAFLANAKYLEIDLGGFTPAGTIVIGGDVTWIINNTIRLTFLIPPQKTEDSRIIIPNIENALKPLSSTPDMSSSPK